MARAAFLPAAMASMAVAAPVTMSPPAKTPGTLVVMASGSTSTVPHRVVFSSVLRVEPSRKSFSGCWPMAGKTQSASMSNSEPVTGTGRRRPLASGSPSSIRMQVTRCTRPCPSLWTATGLVSSSRRTPSFSMSSISAGWAGISLRLRR